MTDMIYITNMTVFFYRTTVTIFFQKYTIPNMQSCFVKKCLCNQLNVTDKNYETKMAYITFKMMDIDTYNHKHTIMTRLIHDCA